VTTGAAPARRSWVQQIMGMPVSVHVRGPGARADPCLADVVDAVFAQLREADRLFSTYRDDSEVSRLRRGDLTPARCHPLVREVLELCEEARERTDGWFDAWLPGGLDPSGLVKGWAVERAAALLADVDGLDHYVNAGGDMAVRVAGPAAPPWRIGVEDPRDRSRLLAVREVRCGGIATSGSAARGAHIVDPRTGNRPDDLLSVTVIGPTLLWADVYATAAVARGRDATDWLAARAPDHEVLVVHRPQDG
jgi:thiamine biosynthesis lipoprotein